MFCSSRAFGPPRCEAPRHISPACTTNQYLPIGSVNRYPEMSGILTFEAYLDFYIKMAAKYGFWEIGIRDFLRDPKKYTFGKSIFKTFCKNRNSEILPPFLSTLHSWMILVLLKMISVDGVHVWLSYTLRVLAYTTNQTISILSCSRIDDCLL